MKTNFLMALLLVCVVSTGVMANEKPVVQELVPLPHPIKIVNAHQQELGVTAEQMERIKNEVVGVFPPQILPMMIQTEMLEEELLGNIMVDGKNKEELAAKIDEIATLKRKLIDKHIDSLNTLKAILSPEQWVAILGYLEDE